MKETRNRTAANPAGTMEDMTARTPHPEALGSPPFDSASGKIHNAAVTKTQITAMMSAPTAIRMFVCMGSAFSSACSIA
ncbi:hypothetical protein GCM10023263_72980 [Phytohabitans rumicis]